VIRRIDPQGLPGDGDELFGDAQEAADREYCVGNPAGGHVDHDFFDLAELVARAVDDVVALQGAGGHHLG